MENDPLHRERITSNITEALFLALTVAFALLALWRAASYDLDLLAVVFLIFSVIFLFYSVNYRALVIHITRDALKVNFGILTWTVPLGNIADCRLDELPALLKYGGAGIHFMTVRGRYRASYNFLEYPRILVAFKKKRGLVRDLSFSTRQPEEVTRTIRELMMEKHQSTAKVDGK